MSIVYHNAPYINNNIHDTVPLANSSNIVQISHHCFTEHNEDVLLLVIMTMTYSKKVPVVVRSTTIDQVMGMMTKGKLTRATATWKPGHFSAVMSGWLQLPHTYSKGDREVGKKDTPSPSFSSTVSRGF